MLRALLIIAAQELRTQLRDSAVLAMSLLFPLLVLPLSVWFTVAIGQMMEGELENDPPRVVLAGDPAELALVLEDAELSPVEDGSPDEAVRSRRIDAALALVAEGESRAATLTFDGESHRGLAAKHRLSSGLDRLRDHRREALAAAAGVDPATLRPRDLRWEEDDSTTLREDMRRYAGAGIAYFFLMMCCFGIFYPAVDLVVGERERGTLETTLSLGVSRAALIGGKLMAVLGLALATGFLGCGAMLIAIANALRMAGEESLAGLLDEIGLQIPGPADLLAPGVAILSYLALTLAIITLSVMPARSFKSAQNLASLPLYGAMLLPMAAALPLRLDSAWALVPWLNSGLIVRDALSGEAMSWLGFAAATGVNAGLTWILVLVALRLFNDERFLYGGWLPPWMLRLIGTEGAS